MRRRAIALLFSIGLAACGLAFSPGDYREPSEVEAGSTVDGSTTVNESSVTNEGSTGIDAGPPRTRIALFAGRRDALTGEAAGQVTIAETMLTSIGSDGSLGPITFDAPPATAAPWVQAAILDGELYLVAANALTHAHFTDRVASPWIVATLPSPPESGIKGWAVDSHALLSGRSSGGDPSGWTAAFSDGGLAGWLKLTAQTTVVRGNARLVRGGDNVYLVGGDTPASLEHLEGIPAHSEVEVAKLNANGELGSFHVTAPLPVVGDGGAFATFDPVAVASTDHLYLLGGLTTSTAATDVVLAAKIPTPATGDLASWVALPKLPKPMKEFAAIVTPSWLVVFGGQVAGSGQTNTAVTTDAILRLAIHADGTFGTSWETAGKLPGGRSGIVGVTY